MKTLKLVLIAAILAFGMTSLPAHSEAKSIKVINLSLEKALQEPGLVAAMYQQLTMASLTLDKNGNYSAIVTYTHSVYRISGPYKVWVRFFTSRPPVPYSANGILR